MYRRTQPYAQCVLTYHLIYVPQNTAVRKIQIMNYYNRNFALTSNTDCFKERKLNSRGWKEIVRKEKNYFQSFWFELKDFFLNTYIYIRSNIRQFIMLIICDARLRDFINTWKTLIVLFVGWKLKKLWQFISLMFIFPPILSLELADPNQGGQTKLGSESNLALRLDPDPTKIPGSEKLDSFL